MQLSQKIKIIIPFAILVSLFLLLWYELFFSRQSQPSALIGETLPHFALPTLPVSDKTFTPNDLRGRVSLLNIWATWCYACSVEHAMLIKISDVYHVPIYSINYKDNPLQASAWLAQHGNPFVMTGIDKSGDVGLDLGIYGTPETFIVSATGKIVYRHVGAIDQSSWDNILYPIIKKYSHAQ